MVYAVRVFECNKNAIYWLSQKSTYANCKVPIFYYHNEDELALAKSLYSLLLLQLRWTSFYKIIGFSVHKYKFFLPTSFFCSQTTFVGRGYHHCIMYHVNFLVFMIGSEYYLPPELKNAF